MFAYILSIENDKRSGRSFSYTSEFDGELFNFIFDYNVRIDTWFLTVSNDGATVEIGPNPILLGNNGMFIDYAYWNDLFPNGFLQVYDNAGMYDSSLRGVDPGLSTFGESKELQYISFIDQ